MYFKLNKNLQSLIGGSLFVDVCSKGSAFIRIYEALNKAWLSMLSTNRISDLSEIINFFSCDQAALRTSLPVCLSVRLFVTPFYYVPVIVSSRHTQELLPMTEAMSMQKGQGHRLKVKVTEVITQLSRFRAVTPV